MARRSREQARLDLEGLIKTYALLASLIDNYKDEDHADMKNARELLNGTLAQLAEQYRSKNGDQALQDFAAKLAS